MGKKERRGECPNSQQHKELLEDRWSLSGRTERSLAGRVPALNLLFFPVCANAPERWQSFNEDDALTAVPLAASHVRGLGEGAHVSSPECSWRMSGPSALACLPQWMV